MIQNRQNQRQQTFFSALEAKYLPTKADRKLGKKRAREEEVDEPSEEAFQKNAKKGR